VVDPDALNVVKKATLAESAHKMVAVEAEVAEVAMVVAEEVAKEVVPVSNVVKKVISPENAQKPVEAVVEVVTVVAEVEVTVEVAEVDMADAVADVVEETPELIYLHKIKLLKKVQSKPIQVLENL